MANFIDRPETRKLIETKAWDDMTEALAGRTAADAASVLVLLDDTERDILCKRLACYRDGPPEDTPKSDLPSLLEAPYATLFKTRVGWLALLMLGQMFTATIIDHFDEQLEKALVLALFIPMIISSGGNSGSQSSVLLIRAMAMGEVRLRDWFRVIYREFIVGSLLGVVLGNMAFARVALFRQGYGEHWFSIGLTIGVTTMAVVLFGSVLGSILPLLMRAIRTDPATSSAPFVATLADVGGLIIYFSIAIVILKGTLL